MIMSQRLKSHAIHLHVDPSVFILKIIPVYKKVVVISMKESRAKEKRAKISLPEPFQSL